MENKIITCDGCREEIKPGKNRDDYYLNLSSVHYADFSAGLIYDVYVIPPIDKNKQFHALACIKMWIMENV